MQHRIEHLAAAGRRVASRLARVGAAATLAALAAAWARPAAAMQSDSSGLRAPRPGATGAESVATHLPPRQGGAGRPVAAADRAEVSARPVTLAPVRVLATTGAASGVLRGSAWRGEYTAPGAVRRAELAITVGPGEEGDDVVSGEVALRVVRDADAFDDRDASARETLVTVPIARAEASGGVVELVTAPFVEPACGCTVTGTFTGTVRGDAIDGRFALRGAATSAPHRGRWRATRVTAEARTSATTPEP